ncbi:hypothetical protein OPT61_g4597 [Boeremia exigua]|uniref:Uncharacterized protein n=1 Tax=Boeremia exigua TaxID=749465 RepID=A0ACC2IDL7_9PLEO|nr:hypothetical protein OPT61_g4597 [Boeremia exigua]
MSSQNRHPRGLHSARLNANFVAARYNTIRFSMQSPSFDLPTIVRTRLQYHFIDEQLLHLALRSAHREQDNNVLDDGNRGLAHYGNLAIQMAMTHEAIIDQGKTLHDIHAQDHWSKTKKARAKACRLLGIGSLIMQSVRQHQQPPSDTVLDHAFSAVIGAMWLDCERQEQKVPHIRSTILKVLRIIDALVEQHSVTTDATEGERSLDRQCDLISDPHGLHPGVSHLDQGEPDDVENFTREWFAQELEGFPFESIAHPKFSLDPQPFFSQGNLAVSLDSHLVHDIDTSNLASSGKHSTCEGISLDTSADELQYERQSSRPSGAEREHSSFPTAQKTLSITNTSVKRSKRKRHQEENEKASCSYQNMLQAERQKLMQYSQVERESLNQFLEHSALDKLDRKGSVVARFLYLTIGSWETIIDYKCLIQLSQGDASICRPIDLFSCNPAAMYNEICRLEKKEASCVLLRRYHILSLCEEEQLHNDDYSHIIVETPSTIDEGRLARPGNPVFARESGLTERLLLKIMPDTDPRSPDFQKARGKIKRLRKLAGRLRLLVKRYGVGILCLLPSGTSFKDMSLTDNKCATFNERRDL